MQKFRHSDALLAHCTIFCFVAFDERALDLKATNYKGRSTVIGVFQKPNANQKPALTRTVSLFGRSNREITQT